MTARIWQSLLLIAVLTAAALLLAFPANASAQEIRVKDLTIADQSLPIRLSGYGLVTGLDGTGDRGRQTIQSVANLLRRFDVEVPTEVLRVRNVAAVLVTAEVSPYLRTGGRFDIHLSSMGDAQSLKGGVLWMTPLVADIGATPVGTGQGSLMISGGLGTGREIETVARIPAGGLLEADLPRPRFNATSRLLLREPDVATAARIAAVIDSTLGPGSATVEDPGSVAIVLRDTTSGFAAALARIQELRVRPDRAARVVIDGRDGTVVTGGDVAVGEAMVSRGGITLSIGTNVGKPEPTKGDSLSSRGDIRITGGASVQKIAAALHAVQATPSEIGAIFESLREVGALSAEVVVR
jgi:flagellar P-ring protein precursor FlgI